MIGRRSEHASADELVLHFYGEGRSAAIAAHLRECPICAAEYEALTSTLALVPAVTPPERGELYGLEVWQRVRPRLSARSPFWRIPWSAAHLVSLAAGVLVVAAVAFTAGRYWPDRQPATPNTVSPVAAAELPSEEQARVAAIADHLERSERVLLDFANTDETVSDVESQQAWAADLVDANRLYRESAAQAGDVVVASVLDDLERSLLDIVHAPARLTPEELNDVRARLDAAALLFKVRILSTEMRERESAPLVPRKTT